MHAAQDGHACAGVLPPCAEPTSRMRLMRGATSRTRSAVMVTARGPPGRFVSLYLPARAAPHHLQPPSLPACTAWGRSSRGRCVGALYAQKGMLNKHGACPLTCMSSSPRWAACCASGQACRSWGGQASAGVTPMHATSLAAGDPGWKCAPVSSPCARGEYAMSVAPAAFTASATPLRSGTRYSSEYCTWLLARGTPFACSGSAPGDSQPLTAARMLACTGVACTMEEHAPVLRPHDPGHMKVNSQLRPVYTTPRCSREARDCGTCSGIGRGT